MSNVNKKQLTEENICSRYKSPAIKDAGWLKLWQELISTFKGKCMGSRSSIDDC